MKVAIVHDWLIAGGAERVVEELHHMYPDAPIYTSYCTPEWRKRLDNKVVTGPLQYLGPIRKFIPFLRIWWFGRLKFKGYDLVISSSGAEAKGIKVPKGTPHIAYIHAPTHYYWSRYDEYLANPGFGKFDWLARFGLKLLVRPLRNWDYRAAQKPTVLLANSTHTKRAIKKYYGRDSTVVFPPVDTERFKDLPQKERVGYIVTGRQTPYKRIDLAVAACTKLDMPLTVVGTGPDHHKLKAMAGPTISFKGYVKDDNEVATLLSSAEGFIFAGIDDFGIAPVEALAAGTPVVAFKAGGALDYVNQVTGKFFEEQTADSLASALQSFDMVNNSPDDIKEFAQRFSKEEFVKNMTARVNKVLQ